MAAPPEPLETVELEHPILVRVVVVDIMEAVEVIIVEGEVVEVVG